MHNSEAYWRNREYTHFQRPIYFQEFTRNLTIQNSKKSNLHSNTIRLKINKTPNTHNRPNPHRQLKASTPHYPYTQSAVLTKINTYSTGQRNTQNTVHSQSFMIDTHHKEQGTTTNGILKSVKIGEQYKQYKIGNPKSKPHGQTHTTGRTTNTFKKSIWPLH
jgi:hypothetical protein